MLQTRQVDEVLPILNRVETAVEKDGVYAAGFISYEAAPAFDPALVVRWDDSFPLVWFGLFDQPKVMEDLPFVDESINLPVNWQPSINRDVYDQAFRQIKDYIALGRTYQVNYTLRLRASFFDDPWKLFLYLARSQPTDYAAYVDTGRFALCSASPELFFRLEGDLLTCRPMKGTARRGRTLEEDYTQADLLHQSVKDRAENVMILDMVRNDLGRVADFGSVQVQELFQVERYPTVWQMTSTVQARSRASLSEIFKAIFPCASITGAPKASTMNIIASLETTPRRAYTGGIGFVGPDRQARFNVAIRTVIVDQETKQAEYGTGGGILWDSTSAGEYDESLLKARLIYEKRPEFSLLETMLWEPENGYVLLNEHLQRILNSAQYFEFPLNYNLLQAELGRLDGQLRAKIGQSTSSHRVRLVVSRSGAVELQVNEMGVSGRNAPVLLGIARTAVDSNNPFLYHKTTHRQVYQQALEGCPDCDDVLLWNERQEVTETCIANLVYRLEQRLYTPPIASGLLPGTFREQLLQQGKVDERVLKLSELGSCEGLYVVNSVRRWREAVLKAD